MNRHAGPMTFAAAMWAVLGLAAATPPPLAAETVALVGGTVHTLGPAGTLEAATVVIEGGRIAAVGGRDEVAVPAGARVVDVSGRVVTPGLFDSMSQLGLVEISLEASTVDAATEDPRITAAFDVVDAVDPRSSLVAVNRVEGLTRAMIAPEATSGPIAGRAAVIDLGGELGGDPASPSRPAWLVSSPAAVVAVIGEDGAAVSGGSRAAALVRLREALEDARDYAAHRDAFDRAERREYAPSRLDLEALVPVVEGRLPLAVVARRASDVEAALRLAAEYGLRLVVVGGEEGWRVAPALAAAGVPVVLDPLANLPAQFESLGARSDNAALLAAAGVTVVFASGETHNGRNLRQAAGNAVAHGLPWEEALAAITAQPARVWGVGDSAGTLEPGRVADLVVWDGDPLEVTTFAERVFIRGLEVPRDSRQLRLRDRYLDLGRPLPPAYTRP